LVLGKYREAIETASTTTWEEVSEYPLGKKYGLVSITPVFDKAGNCIRMVGSVHDVTEKKEQELAINKVNAERERAIAELIDRNKTLEQYTYVVSHNLRAPLANIIGLVDILRSFNIEAADIRDTINDISDSILKLDNVVNDLNAILQVRERNTELKELVSLQQIIDDISLSIADVIKQENVTIKARCDVDNIYSIRSHLYSIFYNLILNSIKFRNADEPPIITIDCIGGGENTTIILRDNGKGIDLKQHSGKMFRLYKRFDTSVKGKGIGLFLVKTQVEDLNGSITVKSEIGRGTEFTISLPNNKD
jgi:signal transduction histidine kinase